VAVAAPRLSSVRATRMMTPARALARLPDLHLDDEIAGLFLHDNARRLFNLRPSRHEL
jgi:hypothetical protein